MKLPVMIRTAVLALSSFRVAGQAFCGAREQSSPNSPSITSVSGTITIPSNLSAYDGSAFRGYIGITGQSCTKDFVQLGLDINVTNSAAEYTLVFQKWDSDFSKQYVNLVKDMSFRPGDRVQLSLGIDLGGTEGTMTARNLNTGQSRSFTLSNNSFTCRSIVEWMSEEFFFSNADLSGMELQFDDCLYSRNGGTAIGGLSSSTLYNQGCTAEKEDDGSLLIIY